MHKLFADWYRIVNTDPSAELLAKRWQGVEATRTGLRLETALELVRLAQVGRPKTEMQKACIAYVSNERPLRIGAQSS
jgi:hypothetical protein